MLARAPQLSLEDAETTAAVLFGVSGTATPLPSERDQNFLITPPDGGRRAVLKIANADEPTGMLEAENAALGHLGPLGCVPALIPTTTGDLIGQFGAHQVRLVTALDGRPLAETRRRTPALLEEVGRTLAAVDESLASFDHPAVHRTFYWDVAGAQPAIRDSFVRIADPQLRRQLRAVLDIAEATVSPREARFRRGVIHGDANDHNLLVDEGRQRVTGLVDFGDMVVSHVVNDLAIGMAYAALGQADPVGVAASVVRGYHGRSPLTDDDLAALFGLMLLRLGLSVAVAARQQAEKPDNAYLGVSQQQIRDTLPTLLATPAGLAEYRFREACDLAPVPHAPRVARWLAAHTDGFAPITGQRLSDGAVCALDLSVGSPLLRSRPEENAPAPLFERLKAAMAAAGASVGAGGYGEARLLYPTTGPLTDEQRTIHLGIDLTLDPGTALFAPIDGTLHGFEDASGRLDYGPVLVLRHDVADDEGPLTFFTLYGHLDRASLDGLEVGAPVRAGARLASVGSPPTNGDWWPHLHFQVITDMLDVPVNFNGVARASQARLWLSLCPDPNLVLGLRPEQLPVPHATDEALTAARRARIGSAVRVSYAPHPVQIVRGWKQYLYDATGRRYLDAYNNVPHVGHAHPAVTDAVARQLATLNTNTRYLHETLVAYADALTATFPDPLRVCFFTASGSEANELALRLARTYTTQRDLVVLESAYHGHTTTLIDVSPYKHRGPGGTATPDWVHIAALPDVYRGAHRGADAGLQYAHEVGALIDGVAARGRGLSGYLAETCPSVGGQLLLPSGYLAEVYARVRAAGGLCIADEVQTGLGRIGSHFWAFEAHGVVPDIVVLGKPIANGYPMGAVVTTAAIAERFDNGMEFFSTFGGSTAACAAALATLEVTREEGLQAHAATVGAHLLGALGQLQTRHPLIGDVRGAGLFVGVELVRDRQTLEPADTEAEAVVGRLRDQGILAGTDGPHHNVLKIRGPLPFSVDDADTLVAALDAALA